MSTIAEKFLVAYHAEQDTEKRFELLADFLNVYYDTDFLKVNVFLEKELENCVQNKLVDGEALLRFMLAYSAFETADLKKGNEEVQKVMALFPQVKNNAVRAQIMNFMAYLYSHQGDFENAFKYAYECIRIGEQTDMGKNKFWGLYTLGVFHFDLKDFDKSEKCYSEALAGFLKFDNPYGAARSQTGLSSVFIQKEKYDEAEKLLQRSLAYYNEMGIVTGQSRSLNDLGVIFRKTGRLDESLECFRKALQLRRDTNHMQGIATSLNEVSEVLLAMKRYPEAEEYLREAQQVCEKVNNKSKLYRAHFLSYQLYRNTNEPWKALDQYEKYDAIKTEVQGQTANNRIKDLQTKAATEKAEKEKEIERLRNVELKSAYDTIELKNKEITDSINYAQRIQRTLLASDSLLDRNLKEYFVFFRPKDIVSGDFYWATEKDGRFYLAICDSTGHGVPGAFMSLLNISFLNEAITEKGIAEPNRIFNHVRQRLIENISSEGGRDGMDGILVCFDKEKKQITYSSANNPPLLMNGALMELPSDNMPVGAGERSDSFTNEAISFQSGNNLYLYTDGYADQFGGPKGKKFKYRQLNELLASISDKPFAEQKKILESSFDAWRGGLEQVDDVLVIGVKL